MTDEPTPLFARCGLDLEHEPHPHPGGHCDGQGVPAPDGDAQPPGSLAELFLLSPTPRPWAWSTLPAGFAAELVAQLTEFAGFLNDVHAVTEDQLVLPCWPKHPGLAHDLAALWAGWVEAHQGLGATAAAAMTWYERWLPHFHARLRTHFGIAPDACNPAVGHRPNWRPAAGKLPAAPPAQDAAADVAAVLRGYRITPPAGD